MEKRSDLSKARSTKSKNPQQLLKRFFFHPSWRVAALPSQESSAHSGKFYGYLLVDLELLREGFGEEGELDKISKLEMSCLNL